MKKEAAARIKINRLLEQAGWRFDDSPEGKANIQLEAGVKFADLGDDFERSASGSIDFLLLDTDGRPLLVVEAKKESIDPLSAKEQARNYARNCGARFVILSNGNVHYFWDTKFGNPDTISRFPTQSSLTQHERYVPNPKEMADAAVDENFVVATQMPNFAADPSFQVEAARPAFLRKHGLKQLRPYQVQALKALQEAAGAGRQRFLFEMATGTGKTLVSAAVIKLFLKTGNARRVLFLVDRLELEDQAQKAFAQYLGKDYRSIVYKESPDSWAGASVVVSTVQTFLAGDRYKKEFSPTDFELVISDEAHRSIGGNSRAVFEYFVGYKLGLTATPKNYLKGVDPEGLDTAREYERRLLLDTYKTFGCEPGEPTFSYDLLKGASEGYLVQPTLVDARTEITAQLLSEEGYAARIDTDDGSASEEIFTGRDYEKRFFNEETNVAMCRALLDNGLLDPAAQSAGVTLFGKTIVFCVSQRHAAHVANILNRLALERWPEQYGGSDFATQVSSQVQGAQQMTINFANNRLGGKVGQPEEYESGKTRITVTVGMMTTGYDCPDLLNVALMRPVFSPADFVQIKGRGTRRHLFELGDGDEKVSVQKDRFKFFDFFASCEYFESEYPYDEKIDLPAVRRVTTGGPIDVSGIDGLGAAPAGPVDIALPDTVIAVGETPVGAEGMRIDREGFRKAVAEDVVGNETLSTLWKNGDREGAEAFAKTNVLDKPRHFLTLDKIKRAFNVDRRITVREFLQVAFREKEAFETKDELLEAEWEKFTEVHEVDQPHYQPAKNFFKAYAVDPEVRDIVQRNQPADFYNCLSFDFEDYARLNGYRDLVPRYIRDYAHHLTNL
jgi:type I restriction enzyme R subunit